MKIQEKINELEDSRKFILEKIIKMCDMPSSHDDINEIMKYINLRRSINYTISILKDLNIEEDDDSLFDVDYHINKNSKEFMGHTLYGIQKLLLSRIEKISADTFSFNIITNANIASILQDLSNYIIDPKEVKKDKADEHNPYPLGKIGQIDLFVDPLMKWDDNRIRFYKEDNEIFVLNIKDTNNVLV